MLNTVYWNELNQTELKLKQKQNSVVVLPIGATGEQQTHIPVGSETFLLEDFISSTLPLVDKEVNVLVLPMMSYSLNNIIQNLGDLKLDEAIFLELLRNVFTSVASNGFKKLLIIYGGTDAQEPVTALVTSFNKKTHLHISHYNWKDLIPRVSDTSLHEEVRNVIKQKQIETSLMMANRPELVDMNQVQKWPSAIASRTDFDEVSSNNLKETSTFEEELSQVGRKIVKIISNGLSRMITDLGRIEWGGKFGSHGKF